MTTLLKTIPRTVVLTALESMRWPLSTAERLAGQATNETWPPTMLFEDFESNALQLVGSVLRDDELVEQGRLQAAKLGELRRALELEARADQTRQQADAKLARDREAAAKERARAEEQARAREAAAARRIDEAEATLADEARAAEADVESAAQQRARAVEATDRRARLAAAEAESKALARQQTAIASTEQANALGERVAAKKQRRKNS